MNKVERPVESKYIEQPLGEYVVSFNALNTDIDLNFQSQARWQKDNKQNFCYSLLKNDCTGIGYIVDVQKCYKNCSEPEDKIYFKYYLNKGIKWLIVDGNNRRTTIQNLFNNELKSGLPHTLMFNPKNKNKPYEVLGGNQWNDLDNKIKDFILQNKKVGYHLITRATANQLSELFCELNQGMNLNRNEQRNAFLGTTSTNMRLLVEKYLENREYRIAYRVQNSGKLRSDSSFSTHKTRRNIDYNQCVNAYIYMFGYDLKRKIDDDHIDAVYKIGGQFEQLFDKTNKQFGNYECDFDFFHSNIITPNLNDFKNFGLNVNGQLNLWKFWVHDLKKTRNSDEINVFINEFKNIWKKVWGDTETYHDCRKNAANTNERTGMKIFKDVISGKSIGRFLLQERVINTPLKHKLKLS